MIVIQNVLSNYIQANLILINFIEKSTDTRNSTSPHHSSLNRILNRVIDCGECLQLPLELAGRVLPPLQPGVLHRARAALAVLA